MNRETIADMQYFIDKICTIFTSPINRNFSEELARQHFVLRIGKITADAIWGIRLDERGAVFIPMEQVISIQEEQEIDPANPEHAKLIEEYEKRTKKKLSSDVKVAAATVAPPANSLAIIGQSAPPPQGEGDSMFVDIAALEQLAKKTKKLKDMENKYN